MTKHYQMAEEWIEVANGPCLIEVVKHATHLHFSAEQPSENTQAFHVIDRPFSPSLSYGGILKAWARAAHSEAEIVVTEGG